MGEVCLYKTVLAFDGCKSPLDELPDGDRRRVMQSGAFVIVSIESDARGVRIEAARFPHAQKRGLVIFGRLFADDALGHARTALLPPQNGLSKRRGNHPTLVIVGLVGAILSADAPTILSAFFAVQRTNRSAISEPLFNVDTDLILADGVRAGIIFVHSD